MNKQFLITIPSYKRADLLLHKDGPLKYMDKTMLTNTCIIYRPEETAEYIKVCEAYGCLGQQITRAVNGIVETRDWIIEQTILKTKKYNVKQYKLIMIDDDIRFAYRPYMDSKYVDQDSIIFNNMIHDMLEYCNEEYPIVGITARQFSNNKTNDYDINTRIIQVYCFYLPVLEKEGVRFSDANIPFMTDYYFILKYLSLGYKNLCLNMYTRDDNIQTPGGCATYRTTELLNKSAIRLTKLFPGIVKPYIKQPAKGSKIQEARVNVRVAWKKAYNKRKTL